MKQSGSILILTIIFFFLDINLIAQKEFQFLTNYEYDYVSNFSEGLAVVRKGDWENRKYGYINKLGKIVIDYQFDYAKNFSEGLAFVGNRDKYGFINKSGEVVIDYQFGFMDPAFDPHVFHDGLALVWNKGKLCFINKLGKVITVIDEAYSFNEGFAAIYKDGKWGFIDTSGKIIIKCEFDYACRFSEGLALVKKNNKYGFIDKTGNVVINYQFDNVSNFTEGLAPVIKNNKYGFIDKTGNVVINYQFNYASNFFEGLAVVRKGDWKNGKYGYINKLGKIIIDYQFDNAEKFSEGYAAIKKNGEYGFIDKFGNLIVDYQFDRVPSKVVDGFAVVVKNKKYDLIKLPKFDIVDADIPKGKIENKKTFALVIGNENYSNEISVPYAYNDAQIFSQYCIKTLGIPENQVHLLLDGSYGQILGELNWLTNIIEVFNSEAKIIIYYAGHGMLDETSKNTFILPVDGNASISETGISLDNIYKRLAEKPTKSVSVFLDACFSGATRNGMLLAGRGVKIQPKENVVNGNLIIFSATDGAQTALPYEGKEHGLFTYFLLKKLNESKGEITFGELSDYLIQNVKQQSIIINQKLQTPKVNIGISMEGKWENIKF